MQNGSTVHTSGKLSMKEHEHFDILGNKIDVGAIVAFSHHNSLAIAKVTKLNPKMISVKRIGGKYKAEHYKYSADTVLIPEKDAVMYILRQT